MGERKIRNKDLSETKTALNNYITRNLCLESMCHRGEEICFSNL